ncbi:anaphase-promoting complex subunit 13 isoform X1 [Marmota marmota marmota]|uniref:anaphase-promoting complex subunit 13 isoform X1 n=1 Tax=Marmota marmota marmota TaxID=9994 RepID=UPI00209286E5|nr:anaphase-promoting complex subunit 13 isoform X1 [Marmota marmota marmota]
MGSPTSGDLREELVDHVVRGRGLEVEGAAAARLRHNNQEVKLLGHGADFFNGSHWNKTSLMDPIQDRNPAEAGAIGEHILNKGHNCSREKK